jgi:tricarballylate dehydrogenase
MRALSAGAQSYGQCSGCHSVSWERYAPNFSDLDATTSSQRHSYPFGIMVNGEGRRFLDEGANFCNYTHTKYSRVVFAQPGNFA